MKKIPLIDFLKGYSIFTIVLYHCFLSLPLPGFISKAIMFGGTGVHLFILISGFGLYASFLRNPIRFAPFIKKRLSKIYIPYIIVVLISALISVFIPIYNNSAYALGGHVFLYKMFDNQINESYGGQFWFISTIIQLYFSFHLLVKLKAKTNDHWFVLIGIVMSITWGIVIVLLNKTDDRVWNSFYLQYVWEFMLGMIIAERVQRNVFEYTFNKNWYLFLGLILIAFNGFLVLKGGNAGRVFNDIPALLGYTFLAIYIYQLKIKPLTDFFIFTGRISFSLYLLHVLVIALVKLTFEYYGFSFSYISIIFVVPLTYIISYYYNKIIESLLIRIT